ncbi:methylmalonate-semialdehyde dehydrogenase [acylating], mitochondrial [Tanacetum coccineum]|uniref:Methylmalonate-semialdehyde dehydrogenase [acylating], mitochondrial n=1 Tax=Tanacetum coccineum TaxID=301880 RepID=A0ABQ5F4I4_9ASTR
MLGSLALLTRGYIVTIKQCKKDKIVVLGCQRGGVYRNRRKSVDDGTEKGVKKEQKNVEEKYAWPIVCGLRRKVREDGRTEAVKRHKSRDALLLRYRMNRLLVTSLSFLELSKVQRSDVTVAKAAIRFHECPGSPACLADTGIYLKLSLKCEDCLSRMLDFDSLHI